MMMEIKTLQEWAEWAEEIDDTSDIDDFRHWDKELVALDDIEKLLEFMKTLATTDEATMKIFKRGLQDDTSRRTDDGKEVL